MRYLSAENLIILSQLAILSAGAMHVAPGWRFSTKQQSVNLSVVLNNIKNQHNFQNHVGLYFSSK
jgi:hypothetical protein